MLNFNNETGTIFYCAKYNNNCLDMKNQVLLLRFLVDDWVEDRLYGSIKIYESRSNYLYSTAS